MLSFLMSCLLTVVQQTFEIRVIDEFILLGNSAIMKCLLPSFVADFIHVISWLVIDTDEFSEISYSNSNFGKEIFKAAPLKSYPTKHFLVYK